MHFLECSRDQHQKCCILKRFTLLNFLLNWVWEVTCFHNDQPTLSEKAPYVIVLLILVIGLLHCNKLSLGFFDNFRSCTKWWETGFFKILFKAIALLSLYLPALTKIWPHWNLHNNNYSSLTQLVTWGFFLDCLHWENLRIYIYFKLFGRLEYSNLLKRHTKDPRNYFWKHNWSAFYE